MERTGEVVAVVTVEEGSESRAGLGWAGYRPVLVRVGWWIAVEEANNLHTGCGLMPNPPAVIYVTGTRTHDCPRSLVCRMARVAGPVGGRQGCGRWAGRWAGLCAIA